MKTILRTFVFTLVTLCLTSVTFAMTCSDGIAQCSLSGAVRDRSGHPMPNVIISISGDNLQQPIVLMTGKSGEYAVQYLPDGVYTIEAFARHYRFRPMVRVIHTHANREGEECEDPDCTHEGHTGTGGRPGVLIGDGAVCEDPECESDHEPATGGRPGVLIGDFKECTDPNCDSDHDPATGGRPGVLIGDRIMCTDPHCDSDHDPATGGRGGDSDGDNGRKKSKKP